MGLVGRVGLWEEWGALGMKDGVREGVPGQLSGSSMRKVVPRPGSDHATNM